MARYFIHLSYDGTAYHGWQVQPNAVSVQQRLNEALATLLRHPVETVGAGRTDTGVHAGFMAVHFDTTALDAPATGNAAPADGNTTPAAGNAAPGLRARLNRLADKLNRLLPPDIAVHAVRPVRPDAHARFSACARTYYYKVYTRKNPFLRQYATRLHFAPDYAAMNRAAAQLLRVSDFTSFSKLHTDTKTNLCRVTRAEWVQLDGDLWQFEITADRFLRNMVRAVVGTLLEVGRGRLSESGFADIIARRDRCAAGESVAARALSLVRIDYPSDIYLDR